MAVPAFDGSTPDVSLLYDVNDLARCAPGWLDRAVVFAGEYGIVAAAAVLVAWCWWRVARRDGERAPAAVAGVAWAVLAAGIALLAAMPVRELVHRSAPAAENQNLDVLLHGSAPLSFVSGHATLTMAVAAGLFMVNRRVGAAAAALALLEGLVRVAMGVNYPTDVLGGFALGTAVTLLLAPVALPLLGVATRAAARSRRCRWLVCGGPVARAPRVNRETDLAA